MSPLMHSGWQVTSVDSTAYTTNVKGDTVFGSRVAFATSAGNNGSVFIPNDQLSVDFVTAEINKRAAMMDSIAQLSQPPEAVDI